MKKYGIMVPLDGQYLWVTDGKDKPRMYDSIAEARKEAEGVWKVYTIKRIPQELLEK